MTDELTGLCRDHSFETAENLCRRCGLEYCELCLVYPFGAKKPLCKECAMVIGGVRSHATRQEVPKRDLRRRVKAWESRVERTRATAAVTAEPLLMDPLAPTDGDLGRVPDRGAALAASFEEIPPPPPAEEPADGVAPPIDWSQPFG